MKKFTFVDLFSGIGGFRVALEKNGGKCIAYSEINKSSIEIYKKNFNTKNEIFLGDLTNNNQFLYSDLVVGGVPCQAWSVAGKNLGFNDPRGQLWFDTIKYIKESKPKVFILENVKGLQDPRNKDSFNLIISNLENSGYNLYYQVLNANDYGTPQKRERIFIIGISKKMKNIFIFPQKEENKKTLSEFLFNKKSNSQLNSFFIMSDIRDGENTIHSWDIIDTTFLEKKACYALLKNRRKSKYGDKDGNPLSFEDLKAIDNEITMNEINSLLDKNIFRKVGDKYDFVNSKQSSGINGIYRIFLQSSTEFATLTASSSNDYLATIDFSGKKSEFIKKIILNKKFRKLEIQDLRKLQGFPENYICAEKISTNIKQFGNAVPVMVIDKLISALIEQNFI